MHMEPILELWSSSSWLRINWEWTSLGYLICHCGHHALQWKHCVCIVSATVWIQCLFSLWIRARLQPTQLLPGQMTVTRMNYPGAASATKMLLCAAMAAMGISTASAVFGKSCNPSSSEGQVTGKLGHFCLFILLGRRTESRKEDSKNPNLSWMTSSYPRPQGLNWPWAAMLCLFCSSACLGTLFGRSLEQLMRVGWDKWVHCLVTSVAF